MDRRKGKVGRVKSFRKKDLGGGEAEDDISMYVSQIPCLVRSSEVSLSPLIENVRISTSVKVHS